LGPFASVVQPTAAFRPVSRRKPHISAAFSGKSGPIVAAARIHTRAMASSSDDSSQRVVETGDVGSGEAYALYESQGAVLIDTPFSAEQVDAVEAAWDRCQEQGIAAFDEPVIVEAIQHEFWEELTKEFLRVPAGNMANMALRALCSYRNRSVTKIGSG
jgi:hypothetical protein